VANLSNPLKALSIIPKPCSDYANHSVGREKGQWTGIEELNLRKSEEIQVQMESESPQFAAGKIHSAEGTDPIQRD
jgi:hypothetical protein